MDSTLSVPVITPEMSTLDAALAYAAAGFYVGPAKRATKNPGSIIGDPLTGKGWQRHTSRDPQVIAAWFAGSDHGVFLHAGRSGCVIFDVDNPDKLHPAIREAITQCRPPYQSTRVDEPGRGHYLFTQPAGRTVGNSLGGLASGWGEVRGLNGVIIAAPSEHKDGGVYQWHQTGPVPALPGYLATQLPDALEAAETATDDQVAAFLAEHARTTRPELLDIHAAAYSRKIAAGESRHDTMTGHLAGAMKEAAAGLLDAKEAADTLEGLFLAAVAQPAISTKQGRPRTGAVARNEWRGLLAWAVAQGRAADANETLLRIADKVPASAAFAAGLDELERLDAPQGKADDEAGGRKSAASVLVELATERYEFGVTEDGLQYGVQPGRHVVRPLRGGRLSLRAELSREYYSRHRKAAPQQALADALLVLEGMAQESDPSTVHLRVAVADRAVWVDLGDAAETVARVTADGWQVVDRGVPVLFRRTALTGIMPTPARSGDLDRLWTHLNVDPEDRALVLAWLVAAFVDPEMPHPVLSVFGEQGTGKSTASRRLVDLADPSPVPLRKPPRDAESWVTAAAGSWVVGLDNLSTVADWLSDSLCRAATGEGDVKRQLYTDGQLAVFAFRRCILLNGIDVGALRGDLADRVLMVNLHRITEAARLTERQLGDEWCADHPEILAALFDLVAGVMQVLPSVRLASKPRMADFARVLAAVDQLLGTEGLSRFAQQARIMAEDSLSADPFLAAVEERIIAEFVGTAAELLAKVTPTDEKWRPPRGWPKDARTVTSLLKRNAPALRKSGWTVDSGYDAHAKVTNWTLVPAEIARNPHPQSPQSPHLAGTAGIAGDEYGQSQDDEGGGPITAVADVTRSPRNRCDECGEPLQNLKQRARGTCGPCEFRKSA